ncbi:HDOD domain-containing protein [Caldimonas caldifontis]|uniref:Histidine kinase n=1 Tax=Caldimonas caldifontis TaxID=1452508 RepID=A0A2S5SVU4_9BURK|nr:HDOD domain-containing protein [Caldimonas caldifontis]PPE66697.1 histidine kinase [Caldimonas caldifontis]
MLTAPLPTLEAWTAHFAAAPIPVLPRTADAMDWLRGREDDLDAHSIAEFLAGDPLMTLKLLSHVATLRRPAFGEDDEVVAETLTAALVYLGVSPFFRAFDTLLTTEELLSGRPEALAGLHDVLSRAARAAVFSLGFAVHRMDADAPALYHAALLNDFAEMLLWCHAPDLALEIRARQRRDPTLRSAQVQMDVLHIRLPELEQALMRTWRLPQMWRRLTDERATTDLQARNVTLAIRLARHTQHGWDNAALPDDIADIAALLNLSPAAAEKKVRDLDSD